MAAVAENEYTGYERSEAGLAVWFKPERFLEPGFDAETYVADLRRFVPLETLSTELEQHLASLKSKLVEVINEDYNDFVSLSTKLVNVDGAVLRMQKPLLALKDKLSDVQGSIQSELQALGEGLQRRQQVAVARALLELMQDTAHVLSKVEKLLAEVESLDASSLESSLGEELDGHSRMFDRVASEVSRLNFYVARGKDLPFIQALEPRISAATQKLGELLSQGLKAALQTHNSSATLHCLHAYAAIGDTAAAEQVVRRCMVSPFVHQLLAEHKQGNPRAGSGADSLAQVLQPIAAEVRSRCGELLDTTMSPQSGLLAFNFLGNAILAEVDEALADSLPGAFSPGVPTAFLANYAAAMQFLEQLEGYAATRASLEALRKSASYDAFLKRWKLPVYFSLRFQEIAGALDSAVSTADLSIANDAPSATDRPSLSLQASITLRKCLLRCCAPEVFVRALADKFVKLALQLLARYAAWLQQGMHIRLQHIENPPVSQHPEQQQAESKGGDKWAVAASAEQLGLVRADLDVLVAWLQTEFKSSLTKLLAPLPDEAVSSVSQALEEGAAAMASQSSALIQGIVDDIVERSAVVLKQLRAITATYRMTARPEPTRPSHYVAGVVAALDAFLGTPAAAQLQRPARQQIIQGVLEGVSARYAAMATELLDSLRKTDQSLRRLKKKKEAADGAAADDSKLSDIEKIAKQLFLNVQEFARQIHRYGLQPANLVEFTALWRCVAPEDQQAVAV
ncbi:hypothetical protein WJX72_002159 [[Myrmecia] bisecta]|uniref:Conserved oligomeric Golgi complex subunit 2 n=1 Tax=[Myrmecia] bisecta TaxID=41462 RepID=A0AAW1P8N5_9CHLO